MNWNDDGSGKSPEQLDAAYRASQIIAGKYFLGDEMSEDRMQRIRQSIVRDAINGETAYADRAWLVQQYDALAGVLDYAVACLFEIAPPQDGQGAMTPEEIADRAVDRHRRLEHELRVVRAHRDRLTPR